MLNKITRHQITNITTYSLVALTSMASFFLSHYTPASAIETSASATVHVSEACSITMANTSPHSADMSNGTYEEDIGSTKFTVRCNDNSGFALYAIGYSNDERGNTNMVGSNTSFTIPTGTEIADGNTTSHWSIKLAKDTTSYLPANLTINNSFDSYHAIPDTYTKVATFTSSTDGTNGTGSSVTATYDTRVSATQAADSYVGKVKFTLVHPSSAPRPAIALDPLTSSDCPAGWVCYAPNYDDIVGSMDSISNTKITSSPQAGKINVGTSATTINLIAPNYKREGYGFAGWSTEFEATSASTIYGPNETISTNPTNGGLDVSTGAILYPVWVASAGNLQGWNNCNSLTTAPNDGTRATLSSITALTDTRDGNVYTIARLADGKCWMVENLRLNNEYTISAENIAKAQGYGDATASTNNGVSPTNNNLGRFIGLAASEDDNFTNNTTANSLYSIDGSNGTININSNSSYYPGYRLPRYNKNNTNMTLNATNSDGTTTLTDSYSTDNNHVRWYSYGNYYNWPATIADTNYYDQNNVSVTNTSICPTGWHLPQGGQAYAEGNTSGVNVTGDTSTYRDFYNLGYILMGSVAYESQVNSGYSYYDNNVTNTAGDTATSAFRKFPNNFIYSGYWDGSSAYGRGGNGYYWSSSASGSRSEYNLYFYSSYVYPGTYNSFKYYGFSVRCIAGS